MLFTDKRLLLANLVLVLLTKFVNACSYLPESEELYLQNLAERNFNIKLYFFSSIFLILANFVLFFARGKKDYWLLVTIIIVTFISAPITLFAGAIDMCGDTIV